MGHKSDELLEQDAVLRQRYHELASNDARPSELQAAEAAIVANAAAASAAIAEGAKPCPKCDLPAQGMRKLAAETRPDGREVTAVYAVGCSGNCELQSLGSTPEKAVEKWNAAEYRDGHVTPEEHVLRVDGKTID